MNSLTNAKGRFHQAVAAAPYLWRSIDARVLAAQIGGCWHNLMTRCHLNSKPASAVARLAHLPVTQHIACWQVVLPVEALAELLDAVTTGELEFDDQVVRYLSVGHGEERKESAYSHWSYYVSDASRPYRGTRALWSAHCLTTSGDRIDDLLRRTSGDPFEFDNALRVLPHPFDGLDGLAKVALGGGEALGGRNACVDILAYAQPLPVILAVECTTGSIGSGGKPGKLVSRARRIAEALTDHEVISVIATALPGSSIAEAEREGAVKDRLAVLAQEDLHELVALATAGGALSASLDYIRSRIPRHTPPTASYRH